MDYQKEYDEYWSRPDRWGSHSFRDPGLLADQIIKLCGTGKILDAGSGMGALVKTLLARGVDAHGLDVAERVVAEANRSAPGRFTGGSLLAMPFPDESFQTVVSTDCLEHIAEADVPKALAELYRVTQRYLFIKLATTPDRDKRWHLTIHDRTWWEQQFFQAGFRKHPALQTILPYESLEKESWQIVLAFEKIPPPVLAQYPLASLKAERDLHMDMLRESGRRSDAHLARYMLARRFLPKDGLVLDAACGLGYGSAILAHGARAARVIGLDSSAFAVNYAKANFSSSFPIVEFHEGDVNQLTDIADESVGLVASFETVEHLREPELFLAEVRRVLKPGGVFLSSVPNLWVDETNHDPNPFHFHVFDFAKLAKLCRRFFTIKEVYRQTAGGGMKLPNATREMRRVNLPVTTEVDTAEWWLIAATKEPVFGERAVPARSGSAVPVAEPKSDAPTAIAVAESRDGSRSEKGGVVLLTSDPSHPLYASWLPSLQLPWTALSPARADMNLLRDAALVVTHDTYVDPGRKLVREVVAAGIPTLILPDGILEYRNTWEHPQLEPGAIFQPVLGHKIACIGRSQARVLESWGNIGKCEITGSPRFDGYCELQRRQRRSDEPFRVLVMTALTPWFTETQHHAVRIALGDLKASLDAQQTIGSFGMEPVWRLTRGLEEEIGLETKGAQMDFSGRELAEVLQQVDAVITTPSSAMLEAMLLGLPVAVLDYTNSPLHVEPAWRISSRAHIPTVLAELMRPPEPKMLFQETTLHDALECATPATPRVVQLIHEMVDHAKSARDAGRPPTFPARILKSETNWHAVRENRFKPEQLCLPAQKTEEVLPKPEDKRDIKDEKDARDLKDSKPAKRTALWEQAARNTQHVPGKKGKILFISHDASRSGAPVLLLNIIRAMREKGDWEPRIVLRAGGPLVAEFAQLGETVICTDPEIESRWFDGVSLIYSNTCTNGMFLRLLPPDGPPVITHVHELPYAIECFGPPNFAAVKAHTSHFIACSEAVSQMLQQHQIPAAKISVIYECISVSGAMEGAATQSAADARRWCGLADEDFVVASCGFADWRKGPDLFIQLAEALRRRNGHARKIAFLWIGRLPANSHGRILLHDIQRLDLSSKVKFIGEQDNPYPFLNACDVFCSCSREDPFPLVMLEAAALGKPTVCFADSGGAPEFCARGAGFSVPYLNVEAMGQKLLELMEDERLRKHTGETASRLVQEQYNLRNFTPHITQLIEKFSRAPKVKSPTSPTSFGEKLRVFGRKLVGNNSML